MDYELSDPVRGILSYLARNLVDDPTAVRINDVRTGDAVTYEIRVGPGDLGKVIGKQGRIANALRTVAKAAATKSKRKVYVEIES